jgi:site-specific DNA recombinase
MPDSAAAPTFRAAIYARVSSEEQREGQTIDSQIAELERFAREKGWALAGLYKDEGWSGALLSRPALDQLRDDARRKLFDFVLLNDVDRLARDVAHLGIVKRDLERCGVRVVFRKLPSDESPTYNLMVNVLGSFAEFEREMIIDRTRRGRRYKVEVRQQFLGATASYGYCYVPKDRATGQDGYLAVVPEEAALVRQMYEWVDGEGLSARQVVARLNQVQAHARKGGRWAKSTVLRILRNETYAGVWHYNKHYSSEPLKSGARSQYRRSLKSSNRLRPRVEWLPVILPAELRIVPHDLWQRVQQQLTKNITFSPRNSKHSYLLKGLVRCGGCGAAYVGDPSHGKFYYRCLSRCKRMPTVKEECLDETVWSAVAEAILNPTTIFDQVGKFREREVEEERIRNSEDQTVGRALAQVRREEARLLEAYRTGIISPTQLGQELELLKKRQSALEVRERNLRRNTGAPSGNNLRQTLEEHCQRVAERITTFNEAERQRFLRLLIDDVIFEDAKVRIRAVIPLDDTTEAARLGARQVPQIGQAGGGVNTTKTYDRDLNPVFAPYRIADTIMHHDGRSTVRIEDMATYHNGHNSDYGKCIQFTLIKSVIKLPQPLRSRNHLGQFIGQVNKEA